MTLRDVRDEDLPFFFEHQREPAAVAMARFGPRDHDAFMTHWRTRVLADPANLKKTIVVDGAVAGNVVSWSSDGKRLVGYWVGSAYWGRGIATEALAEFVAHYERRRPLHAYVAVENAGSTRVLEKCGFRRVGDAVTGEDGVAELLMRLD